MRPSITHPVRLTLVSLLLTLFLCLSAPRVRAQQNPAQEALKTLPYNYQIIARGDAKQGSIFDGQSIKEFDNSSLADFYLSDNGIIIFWAGTDAGLALCKNQKMLACKGKSISGITLYGDPTIEAVTASGDVFYSFLYEEGHVTYSALALNDAVIYNPHAQNQPYSAQKVKELIGTSPKIAGRVGLPKRHLGIYTDALLRDFFGKETRNLHVDIGEDNIRLGCKFSYNRNGQIAMLLTANVYGIFFPSDHSGSAQIIILATPTNASLPPCPHFKEMQEEAETLNKLADTLETDDTAYQEAVIDMLLQGYGSDYARLGLDVDEDQIQSLFASEASTQATRSNRIVFEIRRKAKNRAKIALDGITNNPSYGFESKESLKYFCSQNPADLSEDAWSGLYWAGYIDEPTYSHIYWKNFVDKAFDASISAVIQGALWEYTVTRFLAPRVFAKFPIKFGAASVSLDLVEAQTLKGIAQKELLATTPTPIGKLYGSVSAKALNDAEVAAAKALGKTKYPSWEDGSLIREITLSKEKSFVRVYWQETRIVNGKSIIVSNKKGLWATFRKGDIVGLTGEQIRNKFGLERVPTHVCDVIVSPGAKLRVGWAREVPEWKATGGGRQIQIQPVNDIGIKYTEGKPLP